jgi:hypothetical protein
VTSLLLAAIEFGQGVAVALHQSLELLRKSLTKDQRTKEQQRKMSNSVHADLERI